MILARLKAETKLYHDRLEHERYTRRLTQDDLRIEEYILVLQKFFGFYAPLEERIGAVPEWSMVELDFTARRKTPLLIRDLCCLGATDQTFQHMPICAHLPAIHSFSAALGCMYVLEGATLGGQLISRHMKATFALHPNNGCAFFNSYGPALGPMWKAFSAFLNAYATTLAQQEAVLQAACATYTALEAWLDLSPTRYVAS